MTALSPEQSKTGSISGSSAPQPSRANRQSMRGTITAIEAKLKAVGRHWSERAEQ